MKNQSLVFGRWFLWLNLLLPITGTLALAQQDMIPLRVRLGDVDNTKVVALIALDEGIYKRNGLAAVPFISPDAAEVTHRRGIEVPAQFVGDEQTPIWLGGGTPMIVRRVNDATSGDTVIIATLDQVVHWPMVARQGINRLEDIKGKRIGYNAYGTMTHFIALELCRKMGWDPVSDVSLMERGTSHDSLKNGRVDVYPASEVSYVAAIDAGYRDMGVDTRAWNVPIAGSSIITTRTWLGNNREAARRFVKSIVEAIAMMKKDQTIANRVLAKWYGITIPAHQKILNEGNREMPKKPYPAVDGIKKTMELYSSHEMRRYKPEDFYDDSIMRELDKTGFIDRLYQ